jgi:hypothetical protein
MKRIKMIEIEVENFSKKTKTEKVQFLNNVKDICVYNQELFLSFGIDAFGKMSTNFDLDDVHTFLLGGGGHLL